IGPHNEGCRGGRWTADTTRRTDANGLSVRVSSHRLVSEMQHDRHERIGYALIGMPSRIRFDANVSGHRNATPQVSFLRREMSAGNQLSDHTFGCWTHESTGYLGTRNLCDYKVRSSYSFSRTAGQTTEAVSHDARCNAGVSSSFYKANTSG